VVGKRPLVAEVDISGGQEKWEQADKSLRSLSHEFAKSVQTQLASTHDRVCSTLLNVEFSYSQPFFCTTTSAVDVADAVSLTQCRRCR